MQGGELYELLFHEPPKATPSKKVPDGPLCGNGDIGIAVGADTGLGEVSFYIGKNDIWNSYSYEDMAGMRGYGRLVFRAGGMADSRYAARQNLRRAEVTVSLGGADAAFSIECRALRKSNLIVHRLFGERGTIDMELSFIPTRRGMETSCRTEAENGILSAHKTFPSPPAEWPMEVHSVTKALGTDTEARSEGIMFSLRERECITIVTVLYTNQESGNCTARCERELELLTDRLRESGGAANLALKAYEDAHEEWWERFWKESDIAIPSEPLLERYWRVSHYLMACCCEEGKYAPGIFGNWNTTDEPAWGGDYHLNYNYEAPWWGLYSSNHIGICEPYARPLLEYREKARAAAREKLGCRGLYMLVGIGPKGLRTSAILDRAGNDDINYWGQKSNAAYAALNMVMHFYYTRDEAYACKIYPFLYETAQFWVDYLDWEDDRYVIHKDCIHENGALVIGLVDWADGSEPDYSDDCNPVLTLGLLRTVFKGLLDIGEMLHSPEEEMRQWKHILEHLSDFPTMERNGETVFRYTESGREWRDDNSLGIQHIFPAGCIGIGTDKKLLEVARNTFRQMDRWEDYNGFPTYYTAGVRLGMDSEMILGHMKQQIVKHGMENGFIFFGGGGIECCSAVPTALNEMLLQSHEHRIRLFPVWNLQRNAAFRNLRAYGAFLVSAELRDSEICGLKIESEKGGVCQICLPYRGMLCVTCGGREVEVTERDGIFAFETEEGEVYEGSIRRME